MRPNEALISEEVVSIQKSINHTYKTAQSYRKCFKATDAAQAKRITNVARTCIEHDIRPKMTDGSSKTELAMMHDYTTNKQIHDRIQISRRTRKRGADVFYALYVPTFIHTYLHMYLFPVVTLVISYPSNAFAPAREFQCTLLIPFAFPLHTRFFTFPCIPSCILYTYAWSGLLHLYRTLSTTLIQVAQKRRAHPGPHVWLRFCQSLAEFCSYTCCSHSCAYFLRYSGRSIGQLASDSAGVGRTWLSKYCLVYSIWFFVHV